MQTRSVQLLSADILQSGQTQGLKYRCCVRESQPKQNQFYWRMSYVTEEALLVYIHTAAVQSCTCCLLKDGTQHLHLQENRVGQRWATDTWDVRGRSPVIDLEINWSIYKSSWLEAPNYRRRIRYPYRWQKWFLQLLPALSMHKPHLEKKARQHKLGSIGKLFRSRLDRVP
jgi:hypothetical protein